MNNTLKNRAGMSGLEFSSASSFFRPGIHETRLKTDGSVMLRLLPAFDTTLDESDPNFKKSWVPCGQVTADNVFAQGENKMIIASAFFLALEACYGAYTGWGRNSFHEGGDNCPVLDLFKYVKAKGDDYKGYITKPSRKEKAPIEAPSTQCVYNAMVFNNQKQAWVPEIVVASYTTTKFLLMQLTQYRSASGHSVSSRYPNTAFGDPTDPQEGYMCRVYPGMTDPTNPSRQSALFHLCANEQQGFTEAEYNSVRYPIDESALEQRYILWDTDNVLVEPPSYQEIVDMYVDKADTPEGLPLSLLQEAWSRKANVGPTTALGTPASAAMVTPPPAAAAPAMPPVSAAPAMPPVSAAPAMPPVSAAPAMPPVSSGPAMPPMSAAPAMPPVAAAPTMPPVSATPAMPGNPLPPPGAATPGPSGFPEVPKVAPAPGGGMPAVPAGAPPPPALGTPAAQVAPQDTRQFWVADAAGNVGEAKISAEEAKTRAKQETIQLCDAADSAGGWKKPSEFGFEEATAPATATSAEQGSPAQGSGAGDIEGKSLEEWISQFETEGPQSVPAHLHPQIVSAINDQG